MTLRQFLDKIGMKLVESEALTQEEKTILEKNILISCLGPAVDVEIDSDGDIVLEW